MKLVIDASVTSRALLPIDAHPAATDMMRKWAFEDATLFAPVLHIYEVDSALRRAQQSRLIHEGQMVTARHTFDGFGIEFLLPTMELSLNAIRWAARLPQSKASDAHYLALAEQLRVELWTFDKRLAAAARAAGANWVRLAFGSVA